jgi:choline dehydrogenase-like flavoprotein
VALDKPGVGENFHDHFQVRTGYKITGAKTLNPRFHSRVGRFGMACEYALFRRGPLSMTPSQLGIYVRSDPRRESADLQFLVQALSLEKLGGKPHAFPAISVTLCGARPTSRGYIRLKSGNPSDQPAIKPNYLATEDDRYVTLQGIKIVRKIVSQSAFARYQPSEFMPADPPAKDDAGLLKACADTGGTIFHPVGTAKMGRREDPMAVVDERLRVIGLDGLRVVDASVMPTITSGNTASPTIMIAEKACDMIAEDARN